MTRSEKMTTAVSSGHYVIAIGASAGGLEAIHDFFDHAPEIPNASYVLIQHLSPDYKSLLVDLVSRHTKMKVYEAEHNLKLHTNCIYVIPNNKFITIRSNRLILTEKPPLKVPNNAIDVFLHSLGKDKKQEAIAVLLSGTGTDGTKGIKTIKESGGIVLVQEPTSAKFDGMPNSAITSGNVDMVLPTAEMPKEILNYIVNGKEIDRDIADEKLRDIFELIHKDSGFDFHYYKTPTITRRINKRMRDGNFRTVDEYLDFLTANPTELKQLAKDFLINVTKFFRDSEAFDFVTTQVFPELVASKPAGDTVKLWVCACSTGEEAYSLAILLDRVIQQSGKTLQVKIFASDLEKANIQYASSGLFPLSIEKDISAEILATYFTKEKDQYQILPRIRKQIVFAQHDVTKDPPFIKNDFVSCRNMLIYMNPALQQRVYSILLFAVNVQGYLFLGTSENGNAIKAHTEELHSKWKVYRKVSNSRMNPGLELSDRKSKTVTTRSLLSFNPPEQKKAKGLWEDFRDTLISDFNFAGFYIDRNFEIKEAIGNFEQILSLPKKILKLNLLRMLPSHISTTLISETKDAWKKNEKKVIRNLHFRHNDSDVAMQIAIKPEQSAQNKQFTLIAFHFMPLDSELVTEPVKLVYPDPGSNDYVLALEEELNDTKGHLQHAIEDLETANEELQSSNEELLSANEELQSSNEELQSLNEELHTLNTEHQLKIKELVELNDDLNNYFRSSEIGQIFLDKNLAIRKFNPASIKMINFIESDLGRPISHISTNIRYSGLMEDLKSVMTKKITIEREVQLVNGKNLLMRIMPYVSQQENNAGIVITFIDITTITNLNNILRGVFNSSLSAVFAFQSVRNSLGKIVDFVLIASNPRAAELLNVTDTISGKNLKNDLHSRLLESMYERYLSIIENDEVLDTDVFEETSGRWFEVTAVKMMDGFVTSFADITQRRATEERLKKNYVELVTTRETLRKLNQELEQKVAERTRMLSESEERFRFVAKATNDALWDWDIVNNRMWYSDAFSTKFGYNAETNFTRKFWFEKIHPDDRRKVEEELYGVINSGSTQWTQEYRFRRANGEYAFVLDRGYILQDEYQTPYRMLGSMLDLTVLKVTERELANNIDQRKFMAESMPFIVLTCSADFSVDYVNQQFERYTGMQESSAHGNGWRSAIHTQDVASLDKTLRRVERDFEAELRIKTVDNSYRWNLLRAKARRDDEQHIVNWVLTLIDIQSQKQASEELEAKVKERTHELRRINNALEMSNHELQQFASVASHDLQEPVRKIHLFAQLVKDRYMSESTGGLNYMDKIMHSSARMKSIINNILQFSRLSVDDVEFVPTDFNKIIREILDDLEVAIQDRNAEVMLGDIPTIDAIPGQIHQVFLNLLSNALKFSKPDVPPKIQIASSVVEERSFVSRENTNGEWCQIVITDNGIGFDEQFAENIFVLFNRLHSKDLYEGTGIGLAIVKKIVEKHGGIITAEGKNGVGSTFKIILPLRHQR